jgi:hypothetical protein
LLCKLVCIQTALCGDLRKPRFLFGIEMDFHICSLGKASLRCQSVSGILRPDPAQLAGQPILYIAPALINTCRKRAEVGRFIEVVHALFTF